MMKMSRLAMTCGSVCAAAAYLTVAQAALAQDAVSQPVRVAEDDAADQGGLEEITVTARRQAENLQQTPVSVSALSALTIERLNIQEVTRVGQLTPNVSLSQGAGQISSVAAFIRGIGNQDTLLSVDSPVGIYLDGVYNGRVNATGNFDLVDLERIEVLRGPQGTLFGRNTTGGALNLVTRRPLDEARAQVKAGYGSYDEWYGRLSFDTGEIGSSGLRATIAYLHRERDGFVDDLSDPDRLDPGALNTDAVWFKLVGDWGDFSAALTADYSDRSGVPLAFQIGAVTADAATYYGQSPALGGGVLSVVPGRRLKRVDLATVPTHQVKIGGAALNLEYEFSPAFQIKSISAYRRFKGFQPFRVAEGNLLGPVVTNFNPFTTVIAPVGPITGRQQVRQKQITQEFQVLGETDRLRYVAGLYYFRETYRELGPSVITVILPGAGGPSGLNLQPTLSYDGSSTSYAAFGQASYKPPILDDRLELTLGLRQTRDRKRIDITNFAAPGAPGVVSLGRATFHNTSYNASINVQWTNDVMTYARIGTGYRSGGFAARSRGMTFLPENATTYEVGIKSEFFDRRLRINTAGFYTRYRNLQVAQFTGGTGFVDNANANYPGFEVEIQAAPTSGLTLTGSVGYVRPKYTSFPQINPNTAPGSPPLIDIAKDAKFPYVPRWTTNVGAEYALPAFDFGQLSFRVDYSTSSKRFFHASDQPTVNPLNNLIVDPGQKHLSARITLADIDIGRSRAEVSLWGENLTNHDNVLAGVDFGPALGVAGNTYGPPRRVGVDLKFTY